jgi:primosomal protein N' (replication factor Y)
MVLRMALRFDAEGGEGRSRVGVRLAGPPPKRMTAARARVLAALADGLVRSKAEAAREASVSAGTIDGLLDEGTLEAIVLPREPVTLPPEPEHPGAVLTELQSAAASVLREAVRGAEFSVHLLDGVTGSGKTEVYFEAVAEVLRRGKQALILLPEIALTNRFLDRFAERFGARPAEWHSQVAPRKRARTWEAVASGEVRVVAGARSALFLPFKQLGLVVIDEEHDPAYKQEDGALSRARHGGGARAAERGADRARLRHAVAGNRS